MKTSQQGQSLQLSSSLMTLCSVISVHGLHHDVFHKILVGGHDQYSQHFYMDAGNTTQVHMLAQHATAHLSPHEAGSEEHK